MSYRFISRKEFKNEINFYIIEDPETQMLEDLDIKSIPKILAFFVDPTDNSNIRKIEFADEFKGKILKEFFEQVASFQRIKHPTNEL